MWLISGCRRLVVFNCIALMAWALEEKSESNTGPLIQAFGNGKIQAVGNTQEHIETLDYKSFENQDPVLQKFAKAPQNEHDHYVENSIEHALNGTSVQEAETTIENGKTQATVDSTIEHTQNVEINGTVDGGGTPVDTVNVIPADIPDAAKDEIIKQFLLQEMQKPPVSSVKKHEQKQKILKDLLTNVLSNSDDNENQSNNETIVEVTTEKNDKKDNENILNDINNAGPTGGTGARKSVLDYANEMRELEKVTDAASKTVVDNTNSVYKAANSINNSRIVSPDSLKPIGGNLDRLLSSNENETPSPSVPPDEKNIKTLGKVDEMLNSIPENVTLDAIADVTFANAKEEANEKSINEGVGDIDIEGTVSMKSHANSMPNDKESERNLLTDNTIESPGNPSDLEGKYPKEIPPEFPSGETLMAPKLLAVPSMNMNSDTSSEQIEQTKDNGLQSLTGLTIDQVRAMSDQDILEKIEDNNTIRPEIMEKFNNDPDMMRELLSATQHIPSVDAGDNPEQTDNASLTVPVTELLTNNPLNTVKDVNDSEPLGVDPKVLQSMSDAELQVALISLLASMNPTETNQINLQPTGYGSFVATIGDIDLNMELVPVQSNPLTRKRAKEMFKDVRKALGKAHAKLPSGTDEVVKAVISATVPGGAEAIQAAELVAKVVKMQQEAKRNRSLDDDGDTDEGEYETTTEYGNTAPDESTTPSEMTV